jgi:oligoribonuclease NrnB/cAMP/cGMP phosphodiesterase (DHH superfamily)
MANQVFREAEFYGATHGEPPPDVTGRIVYILDFSYKRAVLEKMLKIALHITVLDHHKSAQADLDGLSYDNLNVVFDMDRSGAGIAWDYFFDRISRPVQIHHVEDRDLWKFNIPNTKEFAAAMFSYDYTFENWDFLMDDANYERLIAEGAAIERKHLKDVIELLSTTKRTMKIAGYEVPVANVPYQFASDAGNILAEGQPFAATYYDDAQYRRFSLRSKPDGLDVSEIASKLAGGGHKNASGFRVPIGWEGDV